MIGLWITSKGPVDDWIDDCREGFPSFARVGDCYNVVGIGRSLREKRDSASSKSLLNTLLLQDRRSDQSMAQEQWWHGLLLERETDG